MTEPRLRTLYEKIWDAHNIAQRVDGQTLLYIDRLYLHEGSGRAFEILKERGLSPKAPVRAIGVADHYAPSDSRDVAALADPAARAMIIAFDRNTAELGIQSYGLVHPQQGIVHVVGPELGLSRPGMTIVCGDSHTATHGALGALAFGIGASEVTQVLATQTLWQRKSKTMLVRVDGVLPAGVTAKDVILAVIGKIGASGATGHVIEYDGSTVRAMSMEARMTVCNMSIEAGARAGLVAPDDTTFQWMAGREYALKGEALDQALAWWRGLPSDADAAYDDRTVTIDAATLAPMVTWGTSPEHVLPVTGRVPDQADTGDPARAQSMADALNYMGLVPGMPFSDIAIQHVFIGSCTNGRLEDLRAAADVVRGRKVAPGVRALVVPGSETVRRDAEALGLDQVFLDAGLEWRHAGCSMCVGMNGDLVPAGEHCASTSNRNFVGHQDVGARTHLVSPATAAAAAITGHLTDPRTLA